MSVCSDQDVHMRSNQSSPTRTSIEAGAAAAIPFGASSAPAAAAAAAAASSAAAAASAAPRGILRQGLSRKRRSLAWDECNLDSNEAERIERGPRMKIDEPKTPYHAPSSLHARSPGPGALALADGPYSPVSTNGAAGAAPSELALGDRLDDISAEALSRRQRDMGEWESDDDEERDESTGAAGQHRSNQSSVSSGTAMSVAHAAPSHVHMEYPRGVDAGGGAQSGSGRDGDSDPDAEAKHAEFESKRKGNYHSMGELLRANRLKALQDDDEDDDE